MPIFSSKGFTNGAKQLVVQLAMTAHSDPMTAFKDIDVALLVGARPRGPGIEQGSQ